MWQLATEDKIGKAGIMPTSGPVAGRAVGVRAANNNKPVITITLRIQLGHRKLQ